VTCRLARALALLLLIGGAPAVAAAAGPQPAADAIGVLEAAENGASVVVGTIERVRKLDVHGYAADLHVDELVGGTANGIAVGDTVQIAWEELSTSRPVRFNDAERVLVCLSPTPTQTLWKKRFPTAEARARTRVVANRGRAFVRAPEQGTLDLLGHYLAAGSESRDDPAALAYLVDLVAVAPPGLAEESLARLASPDGRAAKLAPQSQAALARSAARVERPRTLRQQTLLVVGGRKLPHARDAVAELTARGSDVQATAWLVLGQLDDGLPAEQVRSLLGSDDPELRSVGAMYLSGADARATLASLVRQDPAASVRLAAVNVLVARYRLDSFADVAPALGDVDDATRASAAETIGSLGDPVVPALLEVIGSESERAAGGAIVALAFTGRKGAMELDKIAREHPDLKLRQLAQLAQGKLPGHKH